MLRRGQVAKRLKRSVSTVRRLEGRELFPIRDRRGVHLFYEDEVVEVMRRLAEGHVSAARGAWLSGARSHTWREEQLRRNVVTREGTASAGGELERLRRENGELRIRLRLLASGVGAVLEDGLNAQVLDQLVHALDGLER